MSFTEEDPEKMDSRSLEEEEEEEEEEVEVEEEEDEEERVEERVEEQKTVHPAHNKIQVRYLRKTHNYCLVPI